MTTPSTSTTKIKGFLQFASVSATSSGFISSSLIGNSLFENLTCGYTIGNILGSFEVDFVNSYYSNAASNNAAFAFYKHTSSTAATRIFTISNNGSVAGTTFFATSDYRIKENIIDLEETSYNVDHLRPVHYYNTKMQKESIGFIAHEVQESLPFLVEGEKDEEELQSLDYIGIIGILVKEIKTLKKRTSDLEKLIWELRS
jgi:hypothetical protein